MSYDLLSEPIRKYIRDKGWTQLRPIQNAAISRILSTDLHYILASRTASGKTEAAFLPILSKANFDQEGVVVLYISPLIALINDQFFRVEELCKYLDVNVVKWHGEANVSAKKRLLKNPNGIVLITPESLEAMFVNKPYHIKHLFSKLGFVVIDEIHSFIGSDRGTQLKSILSRLQTINEEAFKVVGLSATISDEDYQHAKSFTGAANNCKVLLDKSAKETQVQFKYFKGTTKALPLDLLKDLYLATKQNKVLIFPNSRGRVEEVAVKLKKIADRVGGHDNYFSHHSSVDKSFREHIEHFAKNSQQKRFCIVCTSTLELGIDIGSVDKVVQIDATHRISSLIQRLGRSGRKDTQKSNLLLYATNTWSLLQSLACFLLYKENFIESSNVVTKPYDLLLHQALSITKGQSGIVIKNLIDQLDKNAAFTKINKAEITEIINHLIEIDFLEKIQFEVIIGLEGEKIVNSRNFYSVFQTEAELKVMHKGRKIGAVPYSPQIRENENILLAAQIWKIKFLDFKSHKIEVIKALDGKKPVFFGGNINIHPRIREKMFELLVHHTKHSVLDESCLEIIKEMRQTFSIYKVQNIKEERPMKVDMLHLSIYTFTGSRINKTIGFLLEIAQLKNTINHQSSQIIIEASKEDFLENWHKLPQLSHNLDKHLENLLEENPGVLSFSKWGNYLPLSFQIELLKQHYFDFEGAMAFITQVHFVENS